MDRYCLSMVVLILGVVAVSVLGEEEPQDYPPPVEGDERTLGLLFKKYKGSKFSLTNGLLGGFYGFRNGLFGGNQFGPDPYSVGLGYRGYGDHSGYGGGYGGPGGPGYGGPFGPEGYYRPGYSGHRGYQQFPGGYGDDHDHGCDVHETKDGAINVK